MSIAKPLLGTLPNLDALFEDFRFIRPIRAKRGGIQYPSEPGWYFLGGLPGSLSVLDTGRGALFAKPYQHVAEVVAARCCNNAIGAFRAVRSAYWLEKGLLPVYCSDLLGIASLLVALVPYAEHDRFSRG